MKFSLSFACLLAYSFPALAAAGPAFNALASADALSPTRGTLENQAVALGASFTGAASAETAAVKGGQSQRAPSGLPALAALPKAHVEPPGPPNSEKERRVLKRIRVGGLIAAGAGVGLFGYAVAAAASGPIGWAAALVFFGGMAAYLAHRRLNGHDDFHP